MTTFQMATENAFVKKCSCGRFYSLEEFKILQIVGVQRVPEGEPKLPPMIELRNCKKCRSTIAIYLDMSGTPLVEIEN